MKFPLLAIIVMSLSLFAFGKPTAPETADPSTYGKTIISDLHIPEKDQEKIRI